MRRVVKRVLKLGVLAGAGYAVWRYFERQRRDSAVGWEPAPFPYPPQPRTDEHPPVHIPSQVEPPGGPESEPEDGSSSAWVEPTGDACPATHPVKAKVSSKIFHVPGGANFERTNPDRCYRDPAAAEADGFRQAAR